MYIFLVLFNKDIYITKQFTSRILILGTGIILLSAHCKTKGVIILLEKGKISNVALVFMLINVVGATAIVFLPAVAAQFAKQDAWMTPAIASIPGIAVILLVTELGRRFPDKTITEYLPIIMGNWVGKAIGFLYIFFFIHTNGVIIRELGELFRNMLLPNTPILIIHSTVILLAAYAIYSGLEVIARVLETIFPLIILLFIVVLLFGLQNAEFQRLLPILENGFSPVLMGSVTPSAWRGEVVILAMYLPYLAEPQKGRILGFWAVILLTVFLVPDAVINTAVFGPSISRLVFPTFTIAREVGGFLDVILLVLWVPVMVTKITQFYYASVLGTAQLFNLKDYKPLVLPIGVILSALSILVVENSAEIPVYITTSFPPFAYFFEWGIPLVLLLVAIARGFKPKY